MAFRRLSPALFSLLFALASCKEEPEPTDYCGSCERVSGASVGFSENSCFDGCNWLDCDTGAMTLRACDMGVDAGLDGGPPFYFEMYPPPCTSGSECTPERGCRTTNARCIDPSTFGETGLGGPADPIAGHPDGEDTFVPTPLFPGGYCTTSYPQEGVTPNQCNVRDQDQAATVCGGCATCIDLFGLDTPDSGADFVPGFCAQSCTPSLTENDCREGYDCLLIQEGCLPGCQSDDECRIAREETNGIEGIQTPADCEDDAAACTPADCGEASPANPDACANPADHFDSLVYDTDSSAICDPATSRCTGAPSTASASGGDPCTDNDQCEPEGFCITESEDGSWVGGSCTKWRCDLEGNGCANDGVCQEAGVGVFGCFEGCTVGGVDPGSEPGTWVAEGSARSTCREGYGCFWGGEGATGEADNGVCLPVDYEPAVTASNVGATCESDADCFSPFGQGFCIQGDGFESGYCSVRNCAAPWFTSETNVCGAGAECVAFDPTDPTFALCVQNCASADECSVGLGCVQFTEESKACWPGCAEDGDCRTGEVCRNPGEPDSACVSE